MRLLTMEPDQSTCQATNQEPLRVKNHVCEKCVIKCENCDQICCHHRNGSCPDLRITVLYEKETYCGYKGYKGKGEQLNVTITPVGNTE